MTEIQEATKDQAAEIARLVMMAMTDDCCLHFCGKGYGLENFLRRQKRVLPRWGCLVSDCLLTKVTNVGSHVLFERVQYADRIAHDGTKYENPSKVPNFRGIFVC